MGVDELIRVLEQECDQLEQVRYRACVTLLLLRAGETRFLPLAGDEIHEEVDQLGEVELLRASAVTGLAAALDVPDDSLTLAQIISQVPAAAASRLRDLQDRLRATLTDLHELTGSGTALAAAELESIRRSLGRWSTSGGHHGYGVAPSVGPSRFDGAF